MSAQRSSGRSFDPIAEHFDRFVELVGQPLNEFLESVLPEEGGARAVDLGCGTGRHAALLAGRYAQVLAVDISTEMLELARRHQGLANITYLRRDLRQVQPDADGTFDLVLSAYALHHVEDLEQGLWGIRGLAAAGGRVVLVDNVAPTPLVPRSWFVEEALRMLALDLWCQRRPPAEAWELLGLNLDPAWLDHLTSDRFLHPSEFSDLYGRVFPGARFTDLYRARAMCWDNPADGRRSPPSSVRQVARGIAEATRVGRWAG
jgi:SAM-dependent methyltransferase